MGDDYDTEVIFIKMFLIHLLPPLDRSIMYVSAWAFGIDSILLKSQQSKQGINKLFISPSKLLQHNVFIFYMHERSKQV